MKLSRLFDLGLFSILLFQIQSNADSVKLAKDDSIEPLIEVEAQGNTWMLFKKP